MLHNLETLTGSSVTATDGEIGSVRNFLFDGRIMDDLVFGG